MNRMHPYTSQAMQPQGQREQQQEPEQKPEAQAGAAPLEELELEPGPSEEAIEAAPDPEKVARELEDMRLRMAAEMDNFKKRLAREHQEQMRYASEKVLSALLPALDNLDLALQYGSRHEACKDMMQGIEMTLKQLLDAVAQSGLVPVGESGEVFNPEIHEAIGMEPHPTQEKGTVTRVLQRGYKLNDRLLRPAKVMVNS